MLNWIKELLGLGPNIRIIELPNDKTVILVKSTFGWKGVDSRRDTLWGSKEYIAEQCPLADTQVKRALAYAETVIYLEGKKPIYEQIKSDPQRHNSIRKVREVRPEFKS